jgi:hypothetical protein
MHGFLALLALAPGLARAEPHDPATPARPTLQESLSGAARDAYEAATVLFNNRDAARALAKYREAYELSKDSRLLFNMAVCERDLRAYAKMQELLVTYERDAGEGLLPEQKAQIEAALAAIRNLVGTVTLAVRESGATVLLDGEPVGTTPLANGLLVDLGQHKLVLSKEGFETDERSIEIAGGSEATLAIALTPRVLPARLSVSAGRDATVVVDGKDVASERFDGQLPPGTHNIRVTAPGKVTYRNEVSLRDGETQSLQVTLRDEPRGALWPWVIGGAVVAAGGAVAGYFLLRSPTDQRAPLPPANWTVQIPGGR